jgi:hypothetical protein
MLVKVVYWVSRVVSLVLQAGVALVAVVLAGFDAPSGSLQPLYGPIVVAFLAVPAAIVLHEAGHALACVALGSKIRAIHLGNTAPNRRHFTIGKVVITPSRITGGRVEHEGARSTGREALISAAGPLADLIAAAALLAAFGLGNGLVLGLALIMAGVGAANLLPYRAGSGRPTDGARLLALVGAGFAEAVRSRDKNGWSRDSPSELRADFKHMFQDLDGPLQPERTTRWLAAFYAKETLAWLAAGVIGRSLRREGRIAELFALHADLPVPTGHFARGLILATHQLAWEVLLVPGLPAEVADRAVIRVQWVLDSEDIKLGEKYGLTREQVLHTLALGKLRQGHFAVVEELSQPALADPKVPAAYQATARATILATIALARHALGQPNAELIAEALALAPTADLVQEADQRIKQTAQV